LHARVYPDQKLVLRHYLSWCVNYAFYEKLITPTYSSCTKSIWTIATSILSHKYVKAESCTNTLLIEEDYQKKLLLRLLSSYYWLYHTYMKREFATET